MSFGITPYDFVQQVYYAQEKVLLDFWPTDDKYKEVLTEANLVLQELQGTEDWTWLRDKLVLGPCFHHKGQIPEFELPPWVYKPSTLHHDSIKLYKAYPGCHCHHHNHEWYDDGHYNVMDYIQVPIASAGDNQWRKEYLFTSNGAIHVNDPKLRAVCIGNTITFNRRLNPFESKRIAVIDVQRRIEEFHICTPYCKGKNPDQAISYERDNDGKWINPCAKIEERALVEVPDPNYVILATAARHAEGSPPASGRIQSLQDQAVRLLSAMRQNDASATDADYLEWDIPGYIEIV